MKKRIFVSFHHELNQGHANNIRRIINNLGYEDISVNKGTKIENEDIKTSEQIRKEIRDNFLKNVDVTIVIVGSDSTNRKHIDWEIRSTIHKFNNSKDGGIVVIDTLKQEKDSSWILNHDLICIYDNASSPKREWLQNSEITERYKWLPYRLYNSIFNNYDHESSVNKNYKHAVFPIISYEKVKNNPLILKLAINQSLDFKIMNRGKWDVNTKMRRRNNEKQDRLKYEQLEP